MRKNKLHLIDMRFHESGHYLDDLKEFYSLEEKYNCTYYAPIGREISLTSDFSKKTAHKGIFFLLVIYRMLLLNRKDKILFLSCSYIPLFILSVLSFNFNYVFRVHSLPVVRVGLYKKIIYLLSFYSQKTVFLDYPVKDFFVNNKISFSQKSICIIGRTIAIQRVLPIDLNKKLEVLYIGALNEEKDLYPIIKGLIDNPAQHIRLSFLSKGISKYSKELNKMSEIYKDIKVFDGFLEREEYDKAIRKSDVLILPYKKSYGIRFSAVLNDALRQGKKVITINLPQFDYYSKKYNACFLYNDSSDVYLAINQLINSPPLDVSLLNKDYSRIVKSNQLEQAGL